MPSSKNYQRDYQQENKYKAKPEQIKARVARNKARQEALDKGQVHKGDNKQIDHIKPLSKGGSNADSNKRVVSASANASFSRNSRGALVSQTSRKERRRSK